MAYNIQYHTENKVRLIDYRTFLSWEKVMTLEKLKELFFGKTLFAFDTETNGLDFDKIKLCGYSFTFDGIKGYYVPIAHKIGENASRDLLDYAVQKICEESITVLMYNKAYDLNVLEISENYTIGVRLNVLDVMGLVWLRDTYVVMPSLKWSSEYFLGIVQPKYDEVAGDKTFDYAKPDDIVEYASLDALCTFRLAFDTLQKHKGLGGIFDIDNRSIEAIRVLGRDKVRMNVDFLNKEKSDTFFRINDLKKKIYNIVGYEFNINSGKQLAEALIRIGIVLTQKTAKGSWKTDVDTLKEIDHPIKDLLVEYSSEEQYLSTFVNGLLAGVDKDGRIRFNYKLMQAVTGRFSSGGDKNTYYSGVNAQNVKKTIKEEVRIIEDTTIVTGWRIEESIEKTIGLRGYICETNSYKQGVRCAFLPDDEDSVFVSMDYSGQELRIVANFSGEPIFMEAFKKGEDVHMTTAKALGVDKPHAKGANFALQYGGYWKTLMDNLGISKEEAVKFYDIYTGTLRSLMDWQKYQKKRARRDGVVYSAFGRPYRLARYFKDGLSWGIQSQGERYALNYVIQGTGADVIRVALYRILIYKQSLQEKKINGFKFISTVHDEINFSVKKSFLHDFMKVAPELMKINFPEWEVPLIVETSIGDNWGRLVKYNYDVETKIFTPKGEFVEKFE